MAGNSLRTPFGNGLLCVLILCLFVAHQTHAESFSRCCRSPEGSVCFTKCMLDYPLTGGMVCPGLCGCLILPSVPKPFCPPGYDYPSISPLKNFAAGATFNEYCKLGCASSVCNVASTLQNSREQVVKEAMERCNNACSEFCTKGTTKALETA